MHSERGVAVRREGCDRARSGERKLGRDDGEVKRLGEALKAMQKSEQGSLITSDVVIPEEERRGDHRAVQPLS